MHFYVDSLKLLLSAMAAFWKSDIVKSEGLPDGFQFPIVVQHNLFSQIHNRFI